MALTQLFAGLFICVIASFANVFGADLIRIDISPDKCIGAVQKSVEITCVSADDVDKEITVMEISRNDGKRIAYLSQCSGVSYGPGRTDNFKAEGSIEKTGGRGYLNLTLTKPRSEDTGIYTCSMYYLDGEGAVSQALSSKRLVVESVDVSALETVLHNLQEEISSLKQAFDVTTWKGTAMIAFSAQSKTANIKSAGAGSVIVFPDLLMNLGQGYDPKTGIFKAPSAGFYVFHLSIEMACGGCHIRLNLVANDRILGKVLAGDPSYEDQSSISAMVQLSKGDRVKVLTFYTTGYELVKEEATVFTGYLIKPQ